MSRLKSIIGTIPAVKLPRKRCIVQLADHSSAQHVISTDEIPNDTITVYTGTKKKLEGVNCKFVELIVY